MIFGIFYSKRWLQYFFIFAAFWVLMLWRLSLKSTSEPSDSNRIKLVDGKNAVWINPSEIVWVEAAGNYVSIHTNDQELVIRTTIKALLSDIKHADIVRASRSSLVNRQAIVVCEPQRGGKAQLKLSNGQEIKVGPSYWPKLQQTLNI